MKFPKETAGGKVSDIDCCFPDKMAYFKRKTNYAKVSEVASQLKSVGQVIPGNKIIYGETNSRIMRSKYL